MFYYYNIYQLTFKFLYDCFLFASIIIFYIIFIFGTPCALFLSKLKNCSSKNNDNEIEVINIQNIPNILENGNSEQYNLQQTEL